MKVYAIKRVLGLQVLLFYIIQRGFAAVADVSCSDSYLTCSISGAYCDLTVQHNQCKCKAGFKERTNNTCVKVLASSCNQSDDCIGVVDAVCVGPDGNMTCICKPTYKMNDNELGCICADGYKRSSNTAPCMKVLTSYCTDSSDCITISNSACSGTEGSKRCACAPGYKSSEDQLSCITVLNSTCNQISDCNGVVNAICANASKTCTCAIGYKTSTDNLSCMRVLGMSCNQADDCRHVANTTCNGNRICVCAAKFIEDSARLLCSTVSSAGLACVWSTVLVLLVPIVTRYA